MVVLPVMDTDKPAQVTTLMPVDVTVGQPPEGAIDAVTVLPALNVAVV